MAGPITDARRRIAGLAALVALAGLPILANAAPAGAAVVSVGTEAEIRAAFTSGADTTIDLTADIVLADCLSLLSWTHGTDLTINGNGHTLSNPSCPASPHRVINYLPNAAAERVITVHNLTITGGAGTGVQGGGIRAENQDATFGASVVVDQGSVITGNSGSGGGGIYSQDGNVTLDHATVSNNQSVGEGGGIFAGANSGQSVTATDSTINSNTSTATGGGISSRSVTLTRSTVAHNTAGTSGGGVQAVFGTTTITNSTITDNTAGTIGGREGGGVLAFGSVTNVTFATIVGNKTVNGGGANFELFNPTSTTLFGTVVAEPLATSGSTVNCQGTLTSSGYNFSDVDDCGFGGGTGDIDAGGSPLLAGLNDTGGPTQTMRPADASPLREKIPLVDCSNAILIDQDQRGAGRPGGPAPNGLCEIGAHEVYKPGSPTIDTATPGDQQVQVAFTPPSDPGGTPILQYTAACSPTVGSPTTVSGAGSPITLTGLTNGVEYACIVIATNADGSSDQSTTVNATPRTIPGAPTGVVATPGNHQMAVAFAAPASDGGESIDSYTVTASPGGATASGASSPITVGGLANNLAYTFTVTATNAAGPGPASAPSAPKTTVFQPDVMTRKSTSPTFTDLNAYTVANTAATTVKLTKSVTFVIRVFNDGTATDTINLKAALSGNNKLSYTFKDGNLTLSNLVTSGRNYTLAPGSFKQITVIVKANAGTPLNANRTATLTSRSLSQANKLDQVKVKVTRN